MKKTIQFTKEGFIQTQNEYAQLKEKRVQAVKELSTARDLGDRSENAAYKVARQKLSQIDRRMSHLTYLLRLAVVIEPITNDTVELASMVTVETNGQQMTFFIVGGYESNITEGKLSTYSPIGKALLGRKKGEEFSVMIPDGRVTYRILDVKNHNQTVSPIEVEPRRFG